MTQRKELNVALQGLLGHISNRVTIMFRKPGNSITFGRFFSPISSLEQSNLKCVGAIPPISSKSIVSS